VKTETLLQQAATIVQTAKKKMPRQRVVEIVEAKKKKLKPRGRVSAKFLEHTFRPGKSGNPGGQPKVYQRLDTILIGSQLGPAPKDWVRAAKLPRRKEPYTKAECVVHVLQSVAMKGDVSAIRLIREMNDAVARHPSGGTHINVNVGGQEAGGEAAKRLRDITARFHQRAVDLQTKLAQTQQELAHARAELAFLQQQRQLPASTSSTQ
jgi:hypothetical protein